MRVAAVHWSPQTVQFPGAPEQFRKVLQLKTSVASCLAVLTISSRVMFLLCLMFFLLLSVSWWLPEGFHNQAEAEGSPSSGPVCSGGSVLLSSSDIPNHWSPWQCRHQHDIRLNLGGIMEVAGVWWTQIWDDQRKLCTASLELKAEDLFWFMASKGSVHDPGASCTWEEYCGNKSMRQRTAVQTVVSTKQRLWWDRLGSSSIKDLHLVTNLLPPATSRYLVRTNLSVNELLEGNALCPNYNSGVRGKRRWGAG